MFKVKSGSKSAIIIQFITVTVDEPEGSQSSCTLES